MGNVLFLTALRDDSQAVVFEVLIVWGDLAREGHDVLLDYPDEVEAISDDLGVGEVLADQSAVEGTRIHADDADVFLSLESREESVQVLWGAAFHDIEDPVDPEVAEGSGELGSSPMRGSFWMDGVFIDAEDRREAAVGTFSGYDFGVFVVKAFDESVKVFLYDTGSAPRTGSLRRGT